MKTASVIMALLAVLGRCDQSVSAATQEILGQKLLVKDPKPSGNPSGVDLTRRKVVILGKEKGSSNTVIGDPVANGATVELIANGASPSSQMINIPPGLIGGVAGWTAIPGGFKWANPTSAGTAGIPVKRVLIRASPSGSFIFKVQLQGKLTGPGVTLAPPAAGTDGGMIFTIGGGDTYCLRFGGPAGGNVRNTPSGGATAFLKSFKIVSSGSHATREAGCPLASACSLVTTWGTNGDGAGEFDDPSGVAELPGVGVYVSDEDNDRIQVFDPGGTFITGWGVSGALPGTFKRPSHVAVDDASLSIYVADSGNDRVQKFDSTGTFLTTWGSLCRVANGAGCVDPDGAGPLALGDGQFDGPSAVAVDALGHVYVADDRNNRIQKFDATGTFLGKWGTAGSGAGEFSAPTGIATDGAGNVYVADSGNDRVQKFDSTGMFLTTWGSLCRLENGTGCTDPDGGGPQELGDGQFSEPSAVTVDAARSVYVADSRNGRIQKFSPTGAFLAKWSTIGDGPGQLLRPTGLTVDAAGNIYVVDRGDRVQKFAPSCGSLGGGGTSTTTTTTTTTTTIGGGSTTTTTMAEGCGVDDTFELIQERIFDARGCSVSTCHGAFAAANLDLRPSASYPELIDVLADNAAAAGAGKKLVVPGNAQDSFLSQKLRNALLPTEGGPMPLVGGPLPAEELDLIDAWIDAGAPAVGEVQGAPCLPPEEYVPADPLSPPAGGYQLVLNGPTLQPGEEEEGCLWVPVPNATDFNVSKWEFSLNPGTHHFAVFEYNRAGAPTTGVWLSNDFGCFSGAQFGNNITGSPQAPYFVDIYPPGVARVVQAGGYLGLNAHYFNEFDVPIQIKVWINLYPYSGTPDHIAKTIVALDDTFTINIPPFTVQTHPPLGQPRARWTNTDAQVRSIIYLGGHMHQNGVRFTVWGSSGTKLYESYDWSHPSSRFFTLPYVLSPGDYFEYECEYDNGVNRPVRLDALGNPTNLVFGVSAEDAMCILTGQYYDD